MSFAGIGFTPDMFRFGMDMSIKSRFANLKWRGYGPHETHIDREIGAYYATHEAKVDEPSQYLVPQSYNNRSGVAWAEITDNAGHGLRISSDAPMGFAALPYTCHELENAAHHFELPQSCKTVLSINHAEMGVGGDTSWGARPEGKYDVKASSNHKFVFTISPI